ncbi:hypothetical protein LWI28_009064 [Acer negundo]|uniref:Uncharacterized protein n=1 Tax=Acer negundo TaxID=4023 RepID=A0AAD5IMD2_ACENE|nr:hypothetical protein LWI28_009064 [Acer negundo]KAK4841456.1 hypothetical protein QYF36_004729 [Acer negundo]
MTMVPAENLAKQQQQQHRRRHRHHHLVYSGYGGCGGGGGGGGGVMSRIQGYDDDYSGSEAAAAACLGSDLAVVVNHNNNRYNNNNNNNNSNNKSMADQDESRTNSLNNEAASSSKDNQEEDHDHHQRDERWLQLGIGTTTHHHTTSHDHIKHVDHHHHHHHQQVDPTAAARRVGGEGLIELDLLHGGGGSGGSSQQARVASTANFHHGHEFRPPPHQLPLMNIQAATGHASTSLFFQQGSSSSTFPHHNQEINWAFRPVHVQPNMAALASSSSSSLMQFGSYFARPFQPHTGILDVSDPTSSDFRVIDPPRRPHSGIWFMLLASQNQAREPFLPQISKSYLRIKDGRMTVRLLIKYLVNKLRLDSESEIEITCRGQQLLPFLTLQHVRDNIWSPRDAVTLLPDSPTSDHVMVLHYARSA